MFYWQHCARTRHQILSVLEKRWQCRQCRHHPKLAADQFLAGTMVAPAQLPHSLRKNCVGLFVPSLWALPVLRPVRRILAGGWQGPATDNRKTRWWWRWFFEPGGLRAGTRVVRRGAASEAGHPRRHIVRRGPERTETNIIIIIIIIIIVRTNIMIIIVVVIKVRRYQSGEKHKRPTFVSTISQVPQLPRMSRSKSRTTQPCEGRFSIQRTLWSNFTSVSIYSLLLVCWNKLWQARSWWYDSNHDYYDDHDGMIVIMIIMMIMMVW